MRPSDSQIAAFHEQGYLILEDVLDDGDLRPVVDEYSALIDERAKRRHEAGGIRSLYEGEPFDRRLVELCREDAEIGKSLDIMQVRGRPTFEFLRNPKLLDIADAFVGSEVLCNPIQHIRATLPTAVTGRRPVPWHQDAGVCWPEADGGFILTIWVPLVDATAENGCLEVLPGSHRLGMRKHTMTAGGLDILDEDLPDIAPVALPMGKGTVLLFNNYTVHHARNNESDTVRWSFDLRYQDAYQPTGRPFYPAFLFRSTLRPEALQVDHESWCQRWEFALEACKGARHYRWGEFRTQNLG